MRSRRDVWPRSGNGAHPLYPAGAAPGGAHCVALRQAPLAHLHNCTYNITMTYEWDTAKASANRRKHGIDFADAATVFSDEYALTIPDDNLSEDRFVTLGIDALGRILVVVFTWRGEQIRIISARKADSHERRQYEDQ